jgi:hypothetical protein
MENKCSRKKKKKKKKRKEKNCSIIFHYETMIRKSLSPYLSSFSQIECEIYKGTLKRERERERKQGIEKLIQNKASLSSHFIA